MPPIETFLNKYGLWIGIGVYVFIKDVAPFLFTKFFPGRLKVAEEQRKERVEELAAEREWQHALEKERAAILGTISKATQDLAVSMAMTNSNIVTILSNQSRILSKQDAHHDSMMEAIGDMRAKTAVTTRKKKNA
jgi:hypothetical protein